MHRVRPSGAGRDVRRSGLPGARRGGQRAGAGGGGRSGGLKAAPVGRRRLRTDRRAGWTRAGGFAEAGFGPPREGAGIDGGFSALCGFCVIASFEGYRSIAKLAIT